MQEWFIDWFDENYLKYYLITQSEELTKKQVDFIIDALSLKKKDKILDLGCGIGRHLLELGKRGISGIGVDLNEKFINFAKKIKKENIDIDFIKMDMRKIDFKCKFDCAISIWTSFGYFNDTENLDLIKKVYKALKKKGKFLIDIENICYLINNLPKERWEEVEDIYILEKNEINIKTSRLKTERLLIKDNKRYLYTRIYRMYTLSEIKIYLNDVGFEIINVYGGYEKDEFNLFSKRLIIVSEKL